MRKLLTFAIPAVLAVGLVAAALNEPGTELAATSKGEVTQESPPAVIEVPATEPTTTTTVAPPPPPEPETTTTTAPPTTTTTVKVTPTTKPKPAATAAAPKPKPAAAPAPQQVDCGTGTAVATAQGYDTGSTYLIRVRVENRTTRHIEIDSIVVRAGFDSGDKVFNLPVAGQRVVAPADANTPTVVVIEIPESASPTPPRTLQAPEFRFHTAGLPECSAQP